MAENSEIDFSPLGMFATETTKQQYRAVVPEVMAKNHDLQAPQQAFEHIRTVESGYGSKLFGLYLPEEATELQAAAFNRQLLRVKNELQIASPDEAGSLASIEQTFVTATQTLVESRGMTHEEADTLLMQVFRYQGIENVDDALERIINGPRITGFEKESSFPYSNEDIHSMLKASFGNEALLSGRILTIEKVPGYPVRCMDTDFGNQARKTYGAKWDGGFLILPDLESYEAVEKQLEGVSSTEELQHTFKLRAAADTSGGYSTILVREFGVEKPSHYDYLQDLPLSEEQKMNAYFLGIVAHEALHGIQAFGLQKEVSERYNEIATGEIADIPGRRFVTEYVDRHQLLYAGSIHQTMREDIAEATRIYLTNSDYLKQHFPKRHAFLQEQLPFLQENALQKFAQKTPTA